MSRLHEICLWFCTMCGTCKVNQRRLLDGEATVQEWCGNCEAATTHSPVAIEQVGRSFRFVTRTI